MKKWISDCCTFHQHVSPRRNLNPTRLVKLGRYEDDSARLYSPKHPVEFAALSYRWGLGKQSETTKDNVTKRYQELNTLGFPKTLQDAIHITRKLGLEYIWIDRICIIQDDKEDWVNEASLMADIYASAYVVLSATATEDCQDGFLQERPKPFLIQYAQHGQQFQEVYARQIETHTCECEYEKPKIDYALYKRGWCMQERFLACRIIHFLPNEILFECQAGRKCECDGASTERRGPNVVPIGGYDNFGGLQAAQEMDTKIFAHNWTRIVQEYSQMKLTYGEDSLPALSGLAACVEHLKPGKYIAGLWEQEIGYQLGWCINPTDDLTRRWEDPKNINILGPTFSWSSHVMGPVEYRYPSDYRFEPLCTLESFNVELATSNPYGQVHGADLCLSGWSMPGNDMIARYKGREDGFTRMYIYFDFGLCFRFDWFDFWKTEELENTVSWETVLCFGLYGYEYDDDEDCFGDEKYAVDALLVQPSQSEVGKYVRIGVVRYLQKSGFNDAAVASTITLV
jgi:hypothetical protein